MWRVRLHKLAEKIILTDTVNGWYSVTLLQVMECDSIGTLVHCGFGNIRWQHCRFRQEHSHQQSPQPWTLVITQGTIQERKNMMMPHYSRLNLIMSTGNILLGIPRGHM